MKSLRKAEQQIAALMAERPELFQDVETVTLNGRDGSFDTMRQSVLSKEEADQILAKAQGRLARGKPIKGKLMARIEEIVKQYPKLAPVLGLETNDGDSENELDLLRAAPARGRPLRKAADVSAASVPASLVRRDSVTGQLYMIEKGAGR